MMNDRSGSMKIAALALAASLLFALPALAGFKEDVARDLGARTASLIAPAPTGEEWLIDADANAGVQTGDLFAVIVKGAPVVNPLTKKTIGNLETVKAVLRVTKVKNGYSYAEVVSGKGEFKAGEEARRFAGLPALFWDYAGDGEGVYTQLQGALPELDWQGYAAAQASKPAQPRPVPNMAPGLIFVFSDKGLGVKDQAFQPLRFYRPEQVAGKVAAAPAAMSPAGASIVTPGSQTQAPAAGTVPGSSSPGMFAGVTKFFGGGGSPPPGPGGALAGGGGGARGGLIVSQMDSKEGVWYGPRIEGTPIGVDVADFDGDGKNEIALGFKDRIVLARVVAGKYEPLADHALGQKGDLLTLDAMDQNGDGRAELYLSMVLMNSPRSQVLELRDGKLEVVIKEIPFFLRKVNLPGEGVALLGQDLGSETTSNRDLTGPIFRVTRSGDKLQRGAAVTLPAGVTLFGFQSFDYAGQRLLARLNINDKLQLIDSTGAPLWESSDYFGGSETSFERPDNSVQGAMNRLVFVAPRLEPGPDGTVLVPVNEGNRTFSAFTQFNNSHLKAVAYDGYSVVERWRTKPQGGYLGDFRMADADNDGALEIVMLVRYSHGTLLKTNYGNSALLIYEMQ
jgi:hypothetical protein